MKKTNLPLESEHQFRARVRRHLERVVSPIKAECRCGQEVLIELHSDRTCRTDGKRIYYPDQRDDRWCVFRCKQCGSVISDSCYEAAYGNGANGADKRRGEL